MTGLFAKAVFGSHMQYLARATQLGHAEMTRIAQGVFTCFGGILNALLPGMAKHLPLLHQAQAGESGWTCMAMMAAYHQCSVDLPTVRRRLALPAQDLNLAQLVRVAGKMSMSCRPRRINPARLIELRAPVILQWPDDHYVILKRVQDRELSFHDPARGLVTLSLEQAMAEFSGIVLECESLSEFDKSRESWIR